MAAGRASRARPAAGAERTGPGRPPTASRAVSGSRRARFGRILLIVGRVLLSWLAAIPRRLGDRLFAMNDAEAYWRDWQITRTHGGLGRRYRDPRFDTLAECSKCRGAGRTAAGRTGAGDAGGAGRRRSGEPAVRSLPRHGPDDPRGGELAMAFGRPRQPNDPSIMASVEAAISTVARPGLFARLWHWRYELGLIAGLLLAAVAIGYALGLAWLIAIAAAALALLVAALAWPPSRQRLIARAWCVITAAPGQDRLHARLDPDQGRPAPDRHLHHARRLRRAGVAVVPRRDNPRGPAGG